jgi:hypothetical protein
VSIPHGRACHYLRLSAPIRVRNILSSSLFLALLPFPPFLPFALFNKLSARVPVSVRAAILVSVQAEQKGQYRIWTPGTTGIEVKTQKVQQNHRVDNVSMLYP